MEYGDIIPGEPNEGELIEKITETDPDDRMPPPPADPLSTEQINRIKNKLREKNILISTDGPYDNVIKSKPPLCFSKENVDEVIYAVDLILKS